MSPDRSSHVNRGLQEYKDRSLDAYKLLHCGWLLPLPLWQRVCLSLLVKWDAKVRQEEREIGGGNEVIRGVEKLLEELVEMETKSEKIEE